MTAIRPTRKPPADEIDFVLPSPRGRGPTRLPEGTAVLRRERDSLREAGARVCSLLECQDLFLDELRTLLRGLDETLHEDSKARIKAQLRSADELLGWCEAVQLDLQAESRRARDGQPPIDLLGLCEDAVLDLGDQGAAVAVAVRGTPSTMCCGDAEAIGRAVQLAILLAAAQSGSRALRLDVGECGAGPEIRVDGLAEALAGCSDERAVALRDAVAAAGMYFAAGSQESGGIAMVLSSKGR